MLKYILAGAVMLVSQNSMAELTVVQQHEANKYKNRVFVVESHKEAIPLLICVNGIQRGTCQKYDGESLSFDILVMDRSPTHAETTYPNAGIKVDMVGKPRYKIKGCKPLDNGFGYCLFDASSKNKTTITLEEIKTS